MTLVYLRQQRVRGLGKNRSCKTGDEAASQRDGKIGGRREVGACLLGHAPECHIMAQLVDRELTDSVWDLSEWGTGTCISSWWKRKDKCLLEQDGNEPGVEIAHAAFAHKAREARDQASRIALLRNHPDARSLQWREENVCKESERERRDDLGD